MQHAWDGQMQDNNNPTLWEEAYWNTGDALNLPVNVNANANVNGEPIATSDDVMQMDGINTTTTASTGAAADNSSGNSNSGSSTTANDNGSKLANSMYMLYTAPGYRG
jgi:hypothetical protein